MNTGKILRIAGGVALGAAALASAGAASERWLHVRVHGSGADGERVSINLPVRMLGTLAPMIETNEFSKGSVHLGHGDHDGADLRKMLEALRDAPEGDFVTVKSEDELIRVARRGKLLEAQVDDGEDERVRVSVPIAVVEALLSGGDGELDVAAALERLAEHEGGDLVRVDSSDESVRIWIDGNENGD